MSLFSHVYRLLSKHARRSKNPLFRLPRIRSFLLSSTKNKTSEGARRIDLVLSRSSSCSSGHQLNKSLQRSSKILLFLLLLHCPNLLVVYSSVFRLVVLHFSFSFVCFFAPTVTVNIFLFLFVFFC